MDWLHPALQSGWPTGIIMADFKGREVARMRREDAVVLIPSLHPDEKLGIYVADLLAHGFHRVVVVDDGSGPDYAPLFEALKVHPECTVLGYPANQGKGFALKHGMRHILEACPDCPGVVTADSDGQHTAEDCLRVAQAMLEHPDRLVLGSRDLSLPDVPPKSRAGNRLTSFFFMLLYGHWLGDTQTGLRGISSALMPRMLEVPGSRFEYEMNVLIHCSGWNVGFEKVPIATIYLDANAGTHFRPFQDSARIYRLLFANFFKFASASALSTLLDHGLFNILERWLLPSLVRWVVPAQFPFISLVLPATAIARLCSALFNYRVNRQFVFRLEKSRGALLRYVALATLVMLASAFLVDATAHALGMDAGLAKIIVDSALFFINYRIMKAWVFPQPVLKDQSK